MGADKPLQRSRDAKCPLADREMPHCYHARPNSLKSSLIVKHCLGDYEDCDIYKSNDEEGGINPEKGNKTEVL